MGAKFIYTINKPGKEHLDEVIKEMRRLGSPTIRVVDCSDHYQAIEGSHRIEAARILRLPLNLEVLDQDDLVDADSLDLDCLIAGEQYTAGEVAAECHHMGAGCYEIDENGMLDLVFEARMPYMPFDQGAEPG